MNKLYIGFTKTVEPPKSGFLFIDDELPEIPRARVFDPMRHSFNPRFYGRNIHTSLIREERLIGGVNFLEELPEKLRHRSLLIKDKVLDGATLEDAETAARYAGKVKGTQGFTDFVREAVE